uniref:Uncharacterized protein n=1 Tax=Phaeodactylum tricornutum TaxID=2850 RepID=A0A8J9T615_PHATR
MPKVLDEDQLRRKQDLERRRIVRRQAKTAEQRERAARHDGGSRTDPHRHVTGESVSSDGAHPQSPLERLPQDALQVVCYHLAAADLGRLLLCSTHFSDILADARLSYVLARLYRPNSAVSGTVGYTDLCRSETAARKLLEQSYGGGDTGQLLVRRKLSKAAKAAGQVPVPYEFVSYARFLEQAVSGYATLDTGHAAEPIRLPRSVQGRFASVSPEHSLCRVGGDGQFCGAGGSGVAAWGVGRRGQLGHGKRRDERLPRRLRGGIGYAVRIVQVSAGGGLVRVAHSLLLTSTGRVLSFGTGQYGALGHGYSAAKQLPDVMRPQYVEGLVHVRVCCVAAGELHSAVVTSDGDVYTWGDGFCGQLGHADKRPQLAPRQVTAGGLEDEVVASISCGSRHTLAVTEDGEVFSWGLGHFGVLGRSFTPFDYDADAAVVNFTVEETLPVDGAVPIPVARIPDNVAPAVDSFPPRDAAAPALLEGRNFAAELMAHLDLIANLSLDDSSDQCIPKVIESLQGIPMVGASAGHRHSLLLSQEGALYSCGAGSGGCLGHGDTQSQMHPVRITAFDEPEEDGSERTRILQMSAGVDISMAVSTRGSVYGWGKTDGGRIGLGMARNQVTLPRRVSIYREEDGSPVLAVDVECGYVHSIVVGLDGTIHMCGGVGVEGEADGQEQNEESKSATVGKARAVPDFNVWHRLPEPKEHAPKERWKKFGKYEVKGRRQMLEQTADS